MYVCVCVWGGGEGVGGGGGGGGGGEGGKGGEEERRGKGGGGGREGEGGGEIFNDILHMQHIQCIHEVLCTIELSATKSSSTFAYNCHHDWYNCTSSTHPIAREQTLIGSDLEPQQT